MTEHDGIKYDNAELLLYAGAYYAGKQEAKWFEILETDVNLSPKADKRIFRKLEKRISYYENHKKYSPIFESFKRVAVVVLAVLSMSFVGILGIEAVRESVFNAVIEWFDRSFNITFPDEDVATETIDRILDYKEPILPEGYERYEIKKGSTKLFVEYENDDLLITYSQSLLSQFDTLVSNENTVVEDITVNGCKGIKAVYTAAGSTTTDIIWKDDFYVYYLSSDIEYEELLKIAESVE